MKVFVTGASGFIGNNLTLALSAQGYDVSVLKRGTSAKNEFNSHRIKVIPGDLSETGALLRGMDDCEWVFHLAAYTRPAVRGLSLPYMTNVTGTMNVLKAAKARSVRKVVLASTAGTLGYSLNGMPVDESGTASLKYHTEYERTKAEAEKAASEIKAG